jgi:predicted Abi (CAAX) family protease
VVGTFDGFASRPISLFPFSSVLVLPLRRLSDSLLTAVPASGWAISLALLGTYAALVLPVGLRNGFLMTRATSLFPGQLLQLAAGLLLMPALGEELLFRVALLPHPLEQANLTNLLGWGLLSTGLFVLYHPLAGASWYPAGRRVFRDSRFLLPCTALGIVCALAYGVTGSLGPPVLIHWIVVVLWLGVLGGRRHLAP